MRTASLAALFVFVGCVPVATPPADAGLSASAVDAGAEEDPPIGGPVDSCEEIDADACFSNEDCPADRRCEDVGPDDLPVPCCVTGERGAVAGGEPCDPEAGQLECESAVCIQDDDTSRCSETCQEDGDCPPGMQRCIFFPFGDTDDRWCFPES